jgi:hypothetical protein
MATLGFSAGKALTGEIDPGPSWPIRAQAQFEPTPTTNTNTVFASPSGVTAESPP